MKPNPESLRRIIEARHHDPFEILGRHERDGKVTVRVYRPDAQSVSVQGNNGILPLKRVEHSDFFEWHGDAQEIPYHYELIMEDGVGNRWQQFDPYCFGPQVSDFDLHLFGEGRHHHAYRFLGAHPMEIEGVSGVRFATWAPNAERISVVGDFNRWDGRTHTMRSRGGGGVWELFIPGLQEGDFYKLELRDKHGHVHLKTDPYGRAFELRPSTAAVVNKLDSYQWNDEQWLRERAERDWYHSPMSVYEVHLGSWQRDEQGHFLNYRELAHRLVDHVKATGFTHIELLPITEHPFDGSWGYQSTGYFAATSRFGSQDDFRYFVDHCHQNGIGVFLDWVPAHFPRDTFALARFDGSPLYEHEDPRRGEHRDWGTLIFNFGRNEVKNFLISSAVFWMEELHLDGLRVDAVASMLYLDYSREDGDWAPNVHGGRENLEAIAFLREMNSVVHQLHPGILTMAEESTAWPMVSRPVDHGGLGFSMKWNMGWMNDTLSYIHRDPVHRKYHHNMLTFGLMYAFTENFILPFSHDEVVHMKRSMLDKMPGDEWQRFANLRLLYTYMFTMPGKKLLFMGNEFGQGQEWNFNAPLDWWVLEYGHHQGVQQLVGDLNRLYRDNPALHFHEFEHDGFDWLECNDADFSRVAYIRKQAGRQLVVVLNFTPRPDDLYRVGVPGPGNYQVRFNSDAGVYGGSNLGNIGAIAAEPIPSMGREWSIQITLPPLAGVILELE